jgi:hypothetical protein
VRHAGKRVAVRALLTASLISAYVNSVAANDLGDALILARIAKRRTTEMAIDLDRLLLGELDDVTGRNLRSTQTPHRRSGMPVRGQTESVGTSHRVSR